MADIYTVRFEIGGESSHARFEFESSALTLAHVLEDAGAEPVVHDMERETIYDGRSPD